MEEVERDLIIETLGHTLGNRTHAATILGISIRALRNKGLTITIRDEREEKKFHEFCFPGGVSAFIELWKSINTHGSQNYGYGSQNYGYGSCGTRRYRTKVDSWT